MTPARVERRGAWLARFRRTVTVVALGWFLVRWAPPVRRRLRASAAVPVEMRNPALWLIGSFTNDHIIRLINRLITRLPLPDPPPGLTIEERRIPRRDGDSIRLMLHEPAERGRPSGAVLWIHGGGYLFGAPEQSVDTCNRLARELDAVIVNVDYRLALDHPFPAGLDDCVDALRWMHEHADELGIDAGRVAVGGDSAGGGLSAAVAQRAHDEGLPLAFQALLYPMLDDRTALRTDHGGTGELVWSAQSNAHAWTAYLGHPPGDGEERPYAAPARRADLAGLAPAWIGAGDIDLFHAEDVEYARRLEAAGVPCELRVVPGMYHGADSIARHVPACIAFTEDYTRALRNAVGPAADRVSTPR